MTSGPSKSRRRREGGDISMFPFLAVLICTMGALILLLIIITYQASLQANRDAEEKHKERKVELAEQREDAVWRRDVLKNSLDKTREKLAELRQQLGYLEKDSSRLREEVIELAKTLKQLESKQAGSANPEELQQQLARLQDKIVDARRRVDEAMTKATGKYQSYAVVPYHGPNETRRHPIYIECRSDGVFLQPEGIRLEKSDFEGFFGPDNPLAAALRAKADYLHQRYQFNEKRGLPYPLLLARQSGIKSYYDALSAMKSWDSEFGYELVDDDMKLDFTEPDPRLKQLIVHEIEQARAKKRALARALPRLYNNPMLARAGGGSGGGRQYYTVSSGKGGIVPYNGDVDEFDSQRPRRPAANRYQDSSSRPGPYDAGGSGTVAGTSPGTSPGETGGNTPADLNGSSPYAPAPYGSAPGGAGTNDISEAGFGGGTSNEVPQQLTLSGTPKPLAPQGSGEGNFGSGGPENSQYTTSPYTGNPYANSPYAGNQYTANPAGGTPNQVTTQTTQASRFGQNATSGQASWSGAAQESGTNQGTDPSGSSEVPMSGGYSQGSSSSDQNGGSGTSSCPFSADTPSSPTSGQPQQPSLGMSQQQPGGSSSNPGAASGEPRDPDPLNPKHHRPKSIAQKRGKDWCLPKEAAYSIPLTRPVSIDCYADRFVFRPTRGGLKATAITLGGQTQGSVNELVSGVWDRVETWGKAGQGMYWRPILSVHVQPGGESRFADLQALFRDSGFAVEQNK